jgi:hypothetical protein
LNRGLRAPRGGLNFRIDFETGAAEPVKPDTDSTSTRSKKAAPPDGHILALSVRATHPVLVLSFADEQKNAEDRLMATLREALHRGLVEAFELEPDELATALIGEGVSRRLLLFEVPEGGTGALKRFLGPGALQDVVTAVLRVCHMNEHGQDEDSACVRACHRCLFSFENQRDWQNLDRRAIRELLLELGQATVNLNQKNSTRSQYDWLKSIVDSRSALEKRFLETLWSEGLRLPDDAQRNIAEVGTTVDFFYRPNTCVFCDGTVHEGVQRQSVDLATREELLALGYRIIVLRSEDDIIQKVSEYPEIFGRTTRQST